MSAGDRHHGSGTCVMAAADETVRKRLDDVFARQDTLEACKRRDAGALIRILGSHGVTQGKIAAMTGIAQSSLSNYKRGKHEAAFASTFEKFADGLDMPRPLRRAWGLSEQSSPDSPGGATGAVG